MTTTRPTSIYDAIGGRDAVAAAVDALYVRLLGDPITSDYFAGVDLPRLNGHLRLFLSYALGGVGQTRPRRDLGIAHAHLGITDEAFDAVAGHLVGVLTDLAVHPDLIAQVVAVVAPLRASIVSA